MRDSLFQRHASVMIGSGTDGERFGSLCIWQWHPHNHRSKGINTSPSMPQPFSLFLASLVRFQVLFTAMQIRRHQVLLCVLFPIFLFKFPHLFVVQRFLAAENGFSTLFILGSGILVSLFPYCEQQVPENQSGENRLEWSLSYSLRKVGTLAL